MGKAGAESSRSLCSSTGYRCLQGTLEADVFHPTYYELLSQVEWSECRQPLVLTVHDMIHERFQKELDPRGKTVERKRRAIAAATAIICVSDAPRRICWKCIRFPKARSPSFHMPPTLRSPPPGNRGLWNPAVLPVYRHPGVAPENFTRLLAALWNLAVGPHGDVRLYVVGPPFRTQEQAQLTELGLQDHVRHRGYVTNEELARLYPR